MTGEGKYVGASERASDAKSGCFFLFFPFIERGKSNLIAITGDISWGNHKLLKSKEMMYKTAAGLRGQRFDDL